MKLKFLPCVLVGVFTVLSLNACSTVLSGGKTLFRNRENDYAHHKVVQPKQLNTPSDLQALKTDQRFPLKAGKDVYPAESGSSNLEPPGLSKKIEINKVAKAAHG